MAQLVLIQGRGCIAECPFDKLQLRLTMAYAVEAVRWTPDQTVESVRWHAFEYVEDGLKKGPSVICGMEEVVRAAENGYDLYLCFRGAVGRKIAVADLSDGRKTLIDLPIGDQAQALVDLPSF